MHMPRLANPGQFLRLAERASPWLGGVTALLLAAGLYMALFASPADYQQEDTVRIMYVHVPAAWMAMAAYAAMAAASAGYLIWKHPLADIAARETAPLGAGFTLVCLVTGALWGRPTWGAWWVWDARLTSVLVLFFLYIGYITLSNSVDPTERGRKACAWLALVGFANIPVIKFSVEWWNTLHQPASMIRAGGPSIHPDMLLPLLLMAGGYLSAFLWFLTLRMRAALREQKRRRMQM